MASINIRRDVNDSFYRYKMPRLLAKIEGKGNGIKTVVPNLQDIAKALNRSPMYILKYFGNELGAQVKEDTKNERFIVNGAHDASKLQESLDGFIQKFVLCLECQNPETFLFIENPNAKGGGEIWRECKACGKKTAVDMKHKLCSFILKNPPSHQNNYKKDKKTTNEEEDDDDEDDEEDDDEEEEEEEIQEEQVGNVSSMLDDWSSLSLEDQLEKIAQYVESNTKNGVVTLTNDQIYEKIMQSKCERLDKVIAVLVQIMFGKEFMKQIDSRKSLFLKLYKKYKDHEKCQRAFLGGIERLVGIIVPELKAKVALILKKLYDIELIEEETFLLWGEGSKKNIYVSKDVAKEIRTKAGPFLTWLKEAEEESDEEDSE